MMIPWIYLCYNRDFGSLNTEDKKSTQKQAPGGLGTSTNVNKSALGLGGTINNGTLNQYNSAFNDSANQ